MALENTEDFQKSDAHESNNSQNSGDGDIVDSGKQGALVDGPLKMALLDARKPAYRFLVLFFNCLLTFGSYFCFDMPSVLQSEFQGNFTCDNNSSSWNMAEYGSENGTTCCSDCLGMHPKDYNLLYAVYAWITVGVFLFSFLCVLGSSLFALGAHFRGNVIMLPLMLIGRTIFGAGNGSLTIVQNRITAFWFMEKELALAFGITLAFSRLGSVLNFFLTHNIYTAVGLTWTLWGGTMLCGLGFCSAVILSFIDIFGVRQLGREAGMQSQSKQLSFLDIRYFSLSYWLLAFTIMFFYNGVFPFVADASLFIQDKYEGYEPNQASYIVGAVYDVSMLMSPFLGGVIDIIGKRGYLAVSCSVLTIPVFGLLAFTQVPPLVATIWLGITYSIAAASLWPSIPLLVSHATLGTAMGLATSVQMIGTGISNLVVGQILGTNSSDGCNITTGIAIKESAFATRDDWLFESCLTVPHYWLETSSVNMHLIPGIKFVLFDTDLPFVTRCEHISKDEKLEHWKYVMIYLLANTLACVATSASLNIINFRRGGVLNFNKHRMHSLLVEYDDHDSGNVAYEQTDPASSVSNDEQQSHKYERLNT